MSLCVKPYYTTSLCCHILSIHFDYTSRTQLLHLSRSWHADMAMSYSKVKDVSTYLGSAKGEHKKKDTIWSDMILHLHKMSSDKNERGIRAVFSADDLKNLVDMLRLYVEAFDYAYFDLCVDKLEQYKGNSKYFFITGRMTMTFIQGLMKEIYACGTACEREQGMRDARDVFKDTGAAIEPLRTALFRVCSLLMSFLKKDQVIDMLYRKCLTFLVDYLQRTRRENEKKAVGFTGGKFKSKLYYFKQVELLIRILCNQDLSTLDWVLTRYDYVTPKIFLGETCGSVSPPRHEKVSFSNLFGMVEDYVFTDKAICEKNLPYVSAAEDWKQNYLWLRNTGLFLTSKDDGFSMRFGMTKGQDRKQIPFKESWNHWDWVEDLSVRDSYVAHPIGMKRMINRLI